MSATLAPTRQYLELRVCDLEPMDVIVDPDRIPVTVVRTRPFDATHIVVDYESVFGPGSRSFDAFADLTVCRILEGSH